MEFITRQRLAWGFGTLFLVVVIIQVVSHARFLFNSTEIDPNDIPIDQVTRINRDYSTLWSYSATLCTLYGCTLGSILYKRQERERRRLMGDMSPDKTIGGWCMSRTWHSRWRRWLSFEIRLFGGYISPGTILLAIGFVAVHIIQITKSPPIGKALADDSIKIDGDTWQQELGNQIAQLALVDIAVAVALSARHSILWRPFGFERAIGWHTWFGRMASVCALYHATFEITIYYPDQNNSLFDTITRSPMAISGSGLIILVSILVFGSHPLVRSMSYRLFRLTHLLSFGGLVVLGILHHWAFLVFYAAVFGVWMVDQIQRYRDSCPVNLISMEALPGKIVKLRLEPLYEAPTFIPGQFAYVSLASSRLASLAFSHPFSISRIDDDGTDKLRNRESTEQMSSPDGNHGNNFYLEPETMVTKTNTSRSVFTFHIKTSGRRTSALYRLAQDTSNEDHGRFSMSRPLGFPLLSMAGHGFGEFETVVLIAQGIGITPWIAVLQYMQQNQVQTKELNLIWSVPSTGKLCNIQYLCTNQSFLDVLHAFMQELSSWESMSYLDVYFDVYITREVPAVDPGLNVLQVHHGRPDYGCVLETIRQRKPDSHVALGLCATDETVQKCGNQVRGARFSNDQSWWTVCAERFEI
ncbi:hypothetical protein CLU79DRAFT_842083 [Phycomyces nitens]|nr:hypothetical protein CLU79DRAFT_842083 [Phycomyces nitens]